MKEEALWPFLSKKFKSRTTKITFFRRKKFRKSRKMRESRKNETRFRQTGAAPVFSSESVRRALVRLPEFRFTFCCLSSGRQMKWSVGIGEGNFELGKGESCLGCAENVPKTGKCFGEMRRRRTAFSGRQKENVWAPASHRRRCRTPTTTTTSATAMSIKNAVFMTTWRCYHSFLLSFFLLLRNLV